MLAKGDRLTIKIDGNTIGQAQSAHRARGHIGLQYDGSSAVARFAAVEIKELPPEEPGWVQLVNRKDLDGWGASPADKWKVVNGEIVGEALEKRYPTLFTKKAFGDFHLRAEVKLNDIAGGGAGLMVRGIGKTHAEINIGVWETERRTGSLAFWDGAKMTWHARFRENLFAPNTWLTFEVIARGKDVTVKVNGTQTAQATLAQIPERGGVGLTVTQPGTVIHCRKFEIKELPPGPEPFVILSKDKRAESLHPTLADAVKAAHSGDTIEIRGDGPFESGPVDLGSKALNLRAAAGARPTLRFVSADERKYTSFIQTKAPLSLEGLQFERAGDVSKQIVTLINATNQPVRMANCRLTLGLNALPVTGDKLEIVNCLIGGASVGLNLSLSRDGYLHVANSCLFGSPIALDNLGGGTIVPKTIRLDNSTFLAGRHLCQLNLYEPDALKKVEAGGQVVFSTSRNYVHLAQKENAGLLRVVLIEQDLPDADVLGFLRGMFRWSESGNLYNLKGGYASVIANMGGKPGPHRDQLLGLEKWHAFWKITDSKSREGAAVFASDDLAHQVFKVDPATLQPADFRLAPGSPGKSAGPDGTDLGADVDLVGPGEAYEKWQNTKEYDEWRKQTDALMAAAVGPFVILAKDKRAETPHATLADAVKAAQSGDTIEIRGDGPFVSDAITIDGKSLVIRAGTGFTPLLRLGAHDLARPTFFRVRSPVVLEGLDLQMVDIDPYDDQKRNSAVLLHATGTSSRVLNCRFTVYRRGDEKSKGHNCHSIGGDGNCQFDVRNCLQIGRSFFLAEMASDTNVVLDNCLVNAHIAIAPILTERLKNARLSVRNCTWAGPYPIRFLLPKGKSDRLTGTMDLEVSSSVLLAGFVVAQTDTSSLAAAEYEERFRAAVRFREDRNLYSLRSKATFFDITAGFNKMPDHKPRETLNEWEEFWGLKKTGSIQAQARFKNYDPASGKGGLMPDDYRLAPGSPGKGAGLGGRDLGADVDLVGPGAAYERWRQTSAYQEWRKKSDALMD